MSKLLSCPHCGFDFGTVFLSVGEVRPPKAGDYAVCFECVGINVYTAHPVFGVGIRAATPAEIFEVVKDPLMTSTITSIRSRKGSW
jgi:hypothetical protein